VRLSPWHRVGLELVPKSIRANHRSRARVDERPPWKEAGSPAPVRGGRYRVVAGRRCRGMGDRMPVGCLWTATRDQHDTAMSMADPPTMVSEWAPVSAGTGRSETFHGRRHAPLTNRHRRGCLIFDRRRSHQSSSMAALSDLCEMTRDIAIAPGRPAGRA